MSYTAARIALVAPTGSGKTTAAWLMQRMVPGAVVVSVAQPLRDVEGLIYHILARPSPAVTGTQDASLLQAVRDLLITREPRLFERIFEESVRRCIESPLVINDDCRLGAKPALDTLGFTYVWVTGKHGHRRIDATAAEKTDNAHDAVIQKAYCSYVIANEGTLEDLIREIRHLLSELGLSCDGQ